MHFYYWAFSPFQNFQVGLHLVYKWWFLQRNAKSKTQLCFVPPTVAVQYKYKICSYEENVTKRSQNTIANATQMYQLNTFNFSNAIECITNTNTT